MVLQFLALDIVEFHIGNEYDSAVEFKTQQLSQLLFQSEFGRICSFVPSMTRSESVYKTNVVVADSTGPTEEHIAFNYYTGQSIQEANNRIPPILKKSKNIGSMLL